MKAGEFFGLISKSEMLRIVQGGKEIYTGYLGMMVYSGDAVHEAVRDAEIKRFSAVPEIRHRDWRRLGLDSPLHPEEMPQYSFSDLQMTLYYTIEI